MQNFWKLSNPELIHKLKTIHSTTRGNKTEMRMQIQTERKWAQIQHGHSFWSVSLNSFSKARSIMLAKLSSLDLERVSFDSGVALICTAESDSVTQSQRRKTQTNNTAKSNLIAERKLGERKGNGRCAQWRRQVSEWSYGYWIFVSMKEEREGKFLVSLQMDDRTLECTIRSLVVCIG